MINISVIIPVFNNEISLERCLDSVVKQSLSGIEIIIVDDGSTDRSGVICDQYAKRYNQCRVIHKKNEGVSQARNDGIKIARGKYIGFVDSDDWIDCDMYLYLYKKAEEDQSDIVVCDVTTIFATGKTENDSIVSIEKSCTLKREEIQPEMIGELAGSACRCIYKRRMIQDNQIIFPKGIKLSEDRIFNLYAFGCAKKISYIKTPYYFRTINNSSAVHRFHEDYFETVKKSYEACISAVDAKWKGSKQIRDVYKKQFVFGAISAINNCFYKTASWSLKRKCDEVKSICDDEDLHAVLVDIEKKDFRLELIFNKRVVALCIVARILNIIHRR